MQIFCSLSIYISTQSFEWIDLQFLFITSPVFGSYLQFIFVILAADLFDPMYIITDVPFNIGISSSKAMASTTNLFVTGIE